MSRRRTRRHRSQVSLALGFLALAVLGGCAGTGELRGRLRTVAPAGGSPLSEAVVYVVAERPRKPGKAAARPRARPRHREVQVTAGGFRPRVVALPAGSTVSFRNGDRVYHKLFSVSAARHFSLRGVAPGEAQTVSFDTVGVVSVYCELHPAAAGYVFVLRDALYATPQANGRFRLPDLPPGSYVIRAWHPTLGEAVRQVEVAAGRPAEIELTF